MAGANAEYVIDIATTFQGEQTIAQLDKLTEKLVSGGTGADVFHDAIAKVANQLTAAKAATLAANAALAEGNERYGALEKAANDASIAFEKAQKAGVVPPGVEAAYRSTTGAVRDQVDALRHLEVAAKAAAGDEAKLKDTLKNVQDLSAHTTQQLKDKATAEGKAEAAERSHEKQLKKTAGALNSMGGPLGTIGARVLNFVDDFGDIADSAGHSGAALVAFSSLAAAAATAIALVTVAVAAATIAMGAWAISLSDSNRTAGLQLDALTALNPKYAAVSDSLAGLTSDTGQSQEALVGLTKKLIDAKVSAAKLPDALRAAALAETALGAGGADQFIQDLKDGKTTVDRFAATAQNKFGGIVQKQLLGLTAQSARFHNNLGNLFGSLNIEPALQGLQKLVALFDDTTAAGQAIKLLFTAVFQPLIDSMDKAATVAEAFILGVLIGFVKLYIALKPTIKKLEELFGINDPATADGMARITEIGEKLAPIIAVLATTFAAVALVVGGLLAAALAAIASPFLLIQSRAALVTAAFTSLRDGWADVTTFLKSISLADIGKGMLDGLVQGIVGAGPAVISALGGVVTGAVAHAKEALGIHSPSKVFAEIGENTGAGMAQGLDRSASDVQSAMSAVVEPPAPTTTPARGAPGGAKGASKSPDLSGATFNFYGVKDAANAKESFGEMLTAFLEGDAAKLGNAKAAT